EPMPQQRMDIRMIKDILRLKYSGGLSHGAIARSLSISKGVVGGEVRRDHRRLCRTASEQPALQRRLVQFGRCLPVRRGRLAPLQRAARAGGTGAGGVSG